MRSLCVAVLLAAAAPALAGDSPRQSGKLGLGVGAGTLNSGLSAKYFVSPEFAFQGVVGVWGLGRGTGSAIGLSAEFLVEMPTLHEQEELEIAWNIGAGPFIAVQDSSFGPSDVLWLGASGVLGVELNFKVVPIDFVLEYRPSILVVPDFYISLVDFGGHVRFYFK
jgi:hypothetical protein